MRDLQDELRALRHYAASRVSGAGRDADSLVMQALRGRRLLLMIGTASFLLLGALSFNALRAFRGNQSDNPVPPAMRQSTADPRTTDQATPDPEDERPPYRGRAIQTQSAGENQTADLVFPNGSTAVIEFDSSLPLGKVGVRPSAALELNASGIRCRTLMVASYGDSLPLHPTGEPLGSYGPPGARAELWAAYPRDPAKKYLMFVEEDWHVGLADSPDGCVSRRRHAEAWADVFRLETSGPFVIVRGQAEVIDPGLVWSTPSFFLHARIVEQSCAPNGEGSGTGKVVVHRSDQFARWCVPGSSVHFYAEAPDDDLLDRLVRGVRTR